MTALAEKKEGAYTPPPVAEEYTRWEMFTLTEAPQATLANWEAQDILVPSVIGGGRGTGSCVVYGAVNLFSARMCRELQTAGMAKGVLRAMTRLVEHEMGECLSIRDPRFDRIFSVRFQEGTRSCVQFDGAACRAWLLRRIKERAKRQKRWAERMGE